MHFNYFEIIILKLLEKTKMLHENTITNGTYNHLYGYMVITIYNFW